MKTLKWIEKNFELVILCAGLIILACLVMLQIIMRYVVNNPLTWSEELCRLVLVWSGFFSIGYCARRDSAIKLDVILNILPKKVLRIVVNLTTVIMIVLLAFLFSGAIKLIQKTTGEMPGLLIPQYWLYIGPAAGIGLGCLRYVQALFRTKFYKSVTEKGEN